MRPLTVEGVKVVTVAVVGATGAVGETIMRVLEERDLGVSDVGPFASRPREAGCSYRGRALDVRVATEDALRAYDVVFFAGGESASERFASPLIERGAIVIDNSATFRMREGVPLVIPEVNPGAVKPEHRLFPVANCTAIILCSALAPVRDVAGLRRVRVATYQAASGAGRDGLDELLAAERALAAGAAEPEPRAFAQPLARNAIPQIGAFDGAGETVEEVKVREETRKMLDLPELAVSATAVRVPVRTAHSEAVFVETERATSVEALAEAFVNAPGIAYHASGIVTPRDVEGTDAVHVARLREEDAGGGTRFAFWCVGDQLRKGAATNAVAILELLIDKGYVRS